MKKLEAPPSAPLVNKVTPAAVLSWSLIAAVTLCALGAMLDGKTGLEKMVTALTLPVQVAWLLCTGWLLASLRRSLGKLAQGRAWLWPGLTWGVFTVCGTPMLGDVCFRYVESLETTFQPGVDAPLDALIVLGGGTSQGPHRAEVDDAGDRVLYAAQLYLQGHTRALITTGSTLPSLQALSTPAQQTTEIWTKLNIPNQAIRRFDGLNTHGEMHSIRLHMGELGPAARVGLLTSAWHLPRAMRLSRAAGLTGLIPVAADHRTQMERRLLAHCLPSASNFNRLELIQREWLAWFVAR